MSVRARFVVSFLVSYMFVYLGPSRATAWLRAGQEPSMASPGLSSLILKSHVSPVGASRERENRGWRGWCRAGVAAAWWCCWRIR